MELSWRSHPAPINVTSRAVGRLGEGPEVACNVRVWQRDPENGGAGAAQSGVAVARGLRGPSTWGRMSIGNQSWDIGNR